jgi:hypothetical protein
MLDLNVLWYVMEHWFSLKASCSSDHYNIYHGQIQHFCFLLAHDIMAKAQTKTYPSRHFFLSSREFAMD